MAYDGMMEKLGDPSTPAGMRKHAVRRLKGMRAQRAGYEPIWQEIARFCQPTLSRFLTSYQGMSSVASDVNLRTSDQINSKLMDSRAVWASEVLGNGMYSGLTSSARPWFKLTLKDKELREFQDVKEWLDTVELRIYELFASTNFYQTTKGGFLELGVFGVEAGFLDSHWEYGMVVQPMTAGEYWIGVNDGLVPDSLYRRADMTVLQHCQRFCKGRKPSEVLPRKVCEAYDRGNYDTVFPVMHAVEPNDLCDPQNLGPNRMAYRSIYWSTQCEEVEANDNDKALLAQEGYRTKPFWTSRWDTRGTEVYSLRSPGLMALADVRQLQLQVLRKQQAIDFGIKPALRGPATLNNVNAALMPGRITIMANLDKDNFGPIWEIDATMLQFLREDTMDTREAVDRDFYADLFQAITNMRGIQPRNIEELAARNEEKLTQLGPVTERTHQEKLKVVIDRAYDILWNARMLPPPPPELDGMDIDVEFISVLAQAQRLVGLGGIERTFGFALSTQNPEAFDSLDVDAAMSEYGDIAGVPAKIMRSADKIKELRDARAQQQQADRAAAMAATIAPAAKQGAEAAKLLYDSPGVGTQPSLATRLLGA